MICNLRENRFLPPPAASQGPFCATGSLLFQQSPSWDEGGQPRAVGGPWRRARTPGSRPNPSSPTCLPPHFLAGGPGAASVPNNSGGPQVPRSRSRLWPPASRMGAAWRACLLISGPNIHGYRLCGCGRSKPQTNPKQVEIQMPAVFHLFLLPRVGGRPLSSAAKDLHSSSGEQVLGCKAPCHFAGQPPSPTPCSLGLWSCFCRGGRAAPTSGWCGLLCSLILPGR